MVLAAEDDFASCGVLLGKMSVSCRPKIYLWPDVEVCIIMGSRNSDANGLVVHRSVRRDYEGPWRRTGCPLRFPASCGDRSEHQRASLLSPTAFLRCSLPPSGSSGCLPKKTSWLFESRPCWAMSRASNAARVWCSTCFCCKRMSTKSIPPSMASLGELPKMHFRETERAT